ncbi:MAG: hypothetical protein V8T86_07360 [Victivallis sp.]
MPVFHARNLRHSPSISDSSTCISHSICSDRAPDWGVDYWRPFSPVSIRWSAGWEYLSWQNYLAAFACIAAAIGIIYWKKRTILEYPMPKLNRELVDFFLKLARRHG